MARSLVDAIIQAESGGRANAQNPRSSAGGAGQFINSTWLSTVKKYRPDIAEGKTDAQILQLKFDPSLSREMAAAYDGENARFLASRGIEPSDSARSLAYFAGPQGAVSIISNPDRRVEDTLTPAAIEANPFLRGKTNAQVVQWAGKRVGGEGGSPAQMQAQVLAARYGGGQDSATGSVNMNDNVIGSGGADTLEGGSGVDALKKQLYDSEKMARYASLEDSGKSAATSGSPWGAVVGPLVQGIGSYLKGSEKEGMRADENRMIESLAQGQNVPPLVQALLGSDNPDYRKAGLQELIKMQGPKAAPDIKTFKSRDQYGREVENQAVWNPRSGRYEPLSSIMPGGGDQMPSLGSQGGPQAPEAAPAAPQVLTQPSLATAPQTGPQPQQPMMPAQPQQPAAAPRIATSPFATEKPAPTGDPQLDQMVEAVWSQGNPQQMATLQAELQKMGLGQQGAAPAQQPAQAQPRPAAPAPAAQAMPAGYKEHPVNVNTLPKPAQGMTYLLGPNGLPMFDARMNPAMISEKEAEERAKMQSGRQTQAESEARVGQQFAGGLERLRAFPQEFGKQAFERAIGPWSASTAQTEDPQGGAGGSGLSFNSIGQNIARGVAELDAVIDGGAAPTEVRDRVETTVKNLAAVMKPLVRKPGEGAWSDKDQENLEKQIGGLTRARSVEEYNRKLDDIRDNVSKVFQINVPSSAPSPRGPNAPKTAEEDVTWFERGPQSYLFMDLW